MKWQDGVFTIGSFILMLTLLPMLRQKAKPPLTSSVPIAFVLYAFAFTYVTLHFVLAPIVEDIQATMWAWMGWQRYQADTEPVTDIV